MIGRLRSVVQPQLFLWIVVYVLFEGLSRLSEMGGEPDLQRRFHDVAWFILRLMAVIYGVSRVLATHPYFLSDYRKWLEQTPWTVDRPLPQGPVHLVWEDGIIIGGLILLHWLLPFPGSIKLLNLFLIFHVLTQAWTFFATGIPTIGYLVLFGLGLTVRFWPSPWTCFAIGWCPTLTERRDG